VEELAAAVAADQPSLFASQVHWAKAVFSARGISPDHLRQGLNLLKDVLAKELPENVAPLAAEYLGTALESFDQQPHDVSPRLLPDTPDGRLASAYLLALLEGDRRRASHLILDSLDGSRSVRGLYLNVLLPAQEEIGRMWLADEVNVAEEHFASHTTKMVMAQLLSRAELRAFNGKSVLTAAVAGNQHDIGLNAVADFFEMDGWRTIHLGANVPVAEVAEAVECFAVDLLALSASLSTQLETVRETIHAVRKAAGGKAVKIIVGGLAFAGPAELPAQLGADGYAVDPEDAVSLGARLVGLTGQ
jgi:methanogenic corrinoid protein MtbC1